MRMLMNVSIPTDHFNEAVRNGTVGQKINHILEEQKDEPTTICGANWTAKAPRKGEAGGLVKMPL